MEIVVVSVEIGLEVIDVVIGEIVEVSIELFFEMMNVVLDEVVVVNNDKGIIENESFGEYVELEEEFFVIELEFFVGDDL